MFVPSFLVALALLEVNQQQFGTQVALEVLKTFDEQRFARDAVISEVPSDAEVAKAYQEFVAVLTEQVFVNISIDPTYSSVIVSSNALVGEQTSYVFKVLFIFEAERGAQEPETSINVYVTGVMMYFPDSRHVYVSKVYEYTIIYRDPTIGLVHFEAEALRFPYAVRRRYQRQW